MEKYGHEFGLTGSRAALGFARSTAGPSEGRPAQARCSGEAVWGRSESRGPRDRAGAAAWARQVENCKLSFRGLVKLLKHPDVKADVAKVRGARGREFVYKAESLAVELSGSSDDDN